MHGPRVAPAPSVAAPSLFLIVGGVRALAACSILALLFALLAALLAVPSLLSFGSAPFGGEVGGVGGALAGAARGSRVGALVAAMPFDAAAWAAAEVAKHGGRTRDAVLVLAGGVGDGGTPHETVLRRLDAAAAMHKIAPVPIVCVGGGTSHKPKWTDGAGFAVPEAHLMAKELYKRGVPLSSIYLEGYSDDTIGNLVFARVLHTEWRSWRDVLVVTSAFQAPRAEAIAQWVFSLTPQPATHGTYAVDCASVPDEGAVDAEALASRVAREEASLASFRGGVGASIATLEQAHEFVFQKHGAYAPRAEPARAVSDVDASALKTY